MLLCSQSNLSIQWQNCYGGSDRDVAKDIVESDDGYLIVGSTLSLDGDISNNHGSSDVWIISIDTLGNFLWEKTYGGSSVESGYDIIKDNQGNYYISGSTYSNDGDIQSGNHGSYDRWVIKIDNTGNLLWERCYGGSKKDYSCQMLLLHDGNILTYGATLSNDGDVPVNYGYLDAWLLKINPEGAILHSKVFGNTGGNNIFDVIETDDKGLFLLSQTESDEGMVDCDCKGMTDVWAVKLDTLWNIEWQKCYGGSRDDYGYVGILELDDGYVFCAQTNSNDGDVSGYHYSSDGATDIWIVKIDKLGNIIWERCLGGTEWEWSMSLNQSDNGLTLFSATSSRNENVTCNEGGPTEYEIWMVKINHDGQVQWGENRCFGGLGSERGFRGVFKKAEKNYVIACSVNNSVGDVNCNYHGSPYDDFWVFEIKDCSLYAPQTPSQPTGPDTLCYTTDSTGIFSISPAAHAWRYEWKLEPETAGTISGDSLAAIVNWNQQYEGQASIQSRSYNDCGDSDWSPVKNTFVYNCVGLEEIETTGVNLKVYPNPATESVVFEISAMPGSSKANPPSIIIRDVYGKTIEQIPVKENRMIWEATEIPPGIYLYQLQVGGVNISGKVMVY